jgi:hypothetical protein
VLESLGALSAHVENPMENTVNTSVGWVLNRSSQMGLGISAQFSLKELDGYHSGCLPRLIPSGQGISVQRTSSQTNFLSVNSG